MLRSINWQTFVWLIVAGALLFFLAPNAKLLAFAHAAKPQLYQQVKGLQSVKGEEALVALDDNKPTLVKLWASWCPLCLAELEETQEWATSTDFESVNLTTIVSPDALGEQSLDEFNAWYSHLNYPFLPVQLDLRGEVVKALGVKAYPSWAVFDAEGKLVRVVKGSINKAQALALVENPEVDISAYKGTFYQVKANQELTPIHARTLYLAGGCFWGVEAYFERIDGVIDAVSGYANGRTENPSYEDVIYKNTGHAETVKVSYNPEKLSLDDILLYYFRIIDPTSLNKQGNDRGTQYRTGVYTIDPNETEVVAIALATLQEQYKRPLVVENVALDHFYEAEQYHQDYLLKNPNGYCHVDLSKADEPLPKKVSVDTNSY